MLKHPVHDSVLLKVPVLASVAFVLYISSAAADSSLEFSNYLRMSSTLDLTLSQNDNIHLIENEPTASTIAKLQPRFSFERKTGLNQIKSTYWGNYQNYLNSSADTRYDQSISLDLDHAFRRFFSVKLNGEYQLLSEPRGSGYTKGNTQLPDAPDSYTRDLISNTYTLGGDDAKGKLLLHLQRQGLNFTSRPEITSDRDYQDTRATLTYYQNFSIKTSALYEVQIASIAYTNLPSNSISKDSAINRYLTGMRWRYSALTTGTAKAGYAQRKFDASSRVGTEILSWALELDWLPTELTRIQIKSFGHTDESSGYGDYKESKTLSIFGRYDLSKSSDLGLGLSVSRNTYPPTAASETIAILDWWLDYQIRPGITASFGANHAQQDSNQIGFDFQRNEYRIQLRINPS
ncbi:MAG: outer membrane beta-barrel protein [Gammaproteobacteria bacterium]|nr:outer membrane beta-barrel protein [Gammaproteobacteria bacterium]